MGYRFLQAGYNVRRPSHRSSTAGKSFPLSGWGSLVDRHCHLVPALIISNLAYFLPAGRFSRPAFCF
jgi:hypothetical protein